MTLVLAGFVATTACKVLLFPSYYSTDLLVHRHWKSATRNLPLRRWYFDDDVIRTRHTVDYPPGFLLFWEAPLANNPVTRRLLEETWVDERCLSLLDDRDIIVGDKNGRRKSSNSRRNNNKNNNNNNNNNISVGKSTGAAPVSEACVAFLRSTVLLGDVALWFGAWQLAAAAAAAASSSSASSSSRRRRCRWMTFVLLVALNPGFLWLDHVHFQYNGLLLGILMGSVSCLLRAGGRRRAPADDDDFDYPDGRSKRRRRSDLLLLLGAALFAMLLTMKHLYLTLSLWYAAFLLRSFCYVCRDEDDKPKFSVPRFLVLAFVTASVLAAPFVPFLLSASESGDDPTAQLKRIFERLFPFERGLVHEYWAGNVWALYTVLRKGVLATIRSSSSRRREEQLLLLPPENLPPKYVAPLLLAVLLVGASHAWKAGGTADPIRRQRRLLLSLAHTAMASFQFAYHVHEKAIMTTYVPLIPLVMSVVVTGGDDIITKDGASPSVPKFLTKRNVLTQYKLMLWETSAWGLLGLFPLLFEPREMLLKWTSYVAYMAVLSAILFTNGWGDEDSDRDGNNKLGALTRIWLGLNVAGIAAIMVALDAVPISAWGRYEFAPLALTSLACAVGLLVPFIRLDVLDDIV